MALILLIVLIVVQNTGFCRAADDQGLSADELFNLWVPNVTEPPISNFKSSVLAKNIEQRSICDLPDFCVPNEQCRIDNNVSILPNVCPALHICCSLDNIIVKSSDSNIFNFETTTTATAPIILPTPAVVNLTESRVKIPRCGVKDGTSLISKIAAEDGDTDFGEFPWMVLLLKEIEVLGTKSLTYNCGGSLIHPKVVLTATHCVKKKPKLIARAGEWDIETDYETTPHQDRMVKEIVLHEKFHGGGYFNDVALLILDSPFELTDNVNTICLARKDFDYGSFLCTASGWGAKHAGGSQMAILKKVDLSIVSRDVCQDIHSKLRKRPYELHESFICAGGEEGKDTCTGDGGSPLVCPITPYDTQFIQTGIVSWGRGCGKANVPGVYANVAFLRDWIEQKLQERNIDTIYFEY